MLSNLYLAVNCWLSNDHCKAQRPTGSFLHRAEPERRCRKLSIGHIPHRIDFISLPIYSDTVGTAAPVALAGIAMPADTAALADIAVDAWQLVDAAHLARA